MMTGRTMRLNSCWTVLDFSVLAALFLTLKADSENCSPGVMVRRNTVYPLRLGEELRVECPVVFCSSSPPTVSWMKHDETLDWVNVTINSHTKTEWKTFNPTHGVSYLIFQNPFKSDSGTYQCRSEGMVSHTILITANDHAKTNNSSRKNDTNSDKSEPADFIMTYVYCAVGTGSFIIIVMIVSVVSMRGCKGKPKTETQTDTQYMEIPMAERAGTHSSSLQHTPRGSPNSLPSRRFSERKMQGHPNELSAGNNEHLYDQRKQNRSRERTVAPPEDSSSVVYAALNHEVPPRIGARPQMTVEETEYAAIRLV